MDATSDTFSLPSKRDMMQVHLDTQRLLFHFGPIPSHPCSPQEGNHKLFRNGCEPPEKEIHPRVIKGMEHHGTPSAEVLM
ncbi:unnamed protein product [Caretta caretta]